ncbi:MAG: DNA-binding response regulator [Actinomycetia bacterium]|jgi:DNA-binding NarL/FixJ family response regulator|nr:DNA-binding response regulator [Actinomycetes bacterium]
MDTISILVVAENFGLTQDLVIAFRRRPGFLILGPVPDETAALELFGEVQPDLVLVQLDRLDGRGVAIISEIRSRTPVRVMAATRDPAAAEMELALAAGACGVLPTDREPPTLVSAFRRAVAGELVLPVDDLPPLVGLLQEARKRRSRQALLTTLTEREREVMAAMAQGVTTTGIALELGISPATVNTHVKNILGKLEVHSKVEAVGVAWRGGLGLGARTA